MGTIRGLLHDDSIDSGPKAESRSRHCPGMRIVICLSVLLGANALADPSANVAAIHATLASLNRVPVDPALFTGDSGAREEFERLLKGRRIRFRPTGSRPTVTISHEPWGEASLGFPLELRNPRFVSGAIQFVTSEVALAGGSCVYRADEGNTVRTPLLFVLRKEGDTWKIAAIRVLAPE